LSTEKNNSFLTVINQWNRKLGKWRKTNAALSKDDFRNAIKPLFLYPCLITAACDRQTGLPKIQITPIKKKYFFFGGGGLEWRMFVYFMSL
jgi:hypothetical protein